MALFLTYFANLIINFTFQIELSDNQISGDELDKLEKYASSLTILKVCGNKISTIEQISKLKSLTALEKLDLSGNEVCKVESYRSKVFETLPTLKVLDGKDKDDQSIESDEEDEYGEEGEFALNEDVQIPDDVLEKLDPEIREKYEKGEINQEELLDFLNNADGFGDLEEEGEFDLDDEEGEAQ